MHFESYAHEKFVRFQFASVFLWCSGTDSAFVVVRQLRLEGKSRRVKRRVVHLPLATVHIREYSRKLKYADFVILMSQKEPAH